MFHIDHVFLEQSRLSALSISRQRGRVSTELRLKPGCGQELYTTETLAGVPVRGAIS